MRNLPVHWYEGLFLRPQHFQAADRYWTELVQTSEQWDHPYNYGLTTLEYSKEALANHQFQVHSLKARMPDGTLVTLESGNEPDRLDLKPTLVAMNQGKVDLAEAFGRESTIKVYVAVPKLQLGRANVGYPGQTDHARYVEAEQSTQDESRGGEDQTIQVRSLNARLLLSTQDLSGYEVLPIAQIRRASEEQAIPRIDPDYIPPVVSITAWPPLGRDIVRAIYDIIGQKIEVLSLQISNRGIGLEGRDPGDLDRIMMLAELNVAFSTLAVLAFAQGVHPFVAYTELCRIVGQLSIFAPERRAERYPGLRPRRPGRHLSRKSASASSGSSTRCAITNSSSVISSASAWACR